MLTYRAERFSKSQQAEKKQMNRVLDILIFSASVQQVNKRRDPSKINEMLVMLLKWLSEGKK